MKGIVFPQTRFFLWELLLIKRLKSKKLSPILYISFKSCILGGLIFYLKKCPGDKNNSSSFWLILIGGNDISEKIKPRKLLGLIKNFMKQIVDVRSLHVVFGSLIPRPGIFRIFPSLEKLTIHITIPPLHHARYHTPP